MGLKARVPVLDSEIQEALSALATALTKRLDLNGRDSFIGPHEILGVLREECREHEAEVHANSVDRQCEELLDISVTCVFGIASLKARRRVLMEGS